MGESANGLHVLRKRSPVGVGISKKADGAWPRPKTMLEPPKRDRGSKYNNWSLTIACFTKYPGDARAHQPYYLGIHGSLWKIKIPSFQGEHRALSLVPTKSINSVHTCAQSLWGALRASGQWVPAAGGPGGSGGPAAPSKAAGGRCFCRGCRWSQSTLDSACLCKWLLRSDAPASPPNNWKTPVRLPAVGKIFSENTTCYY